MRKVPILPTLLVLIAAGVMIRLGFWQLDRLHQKEAMLAGYRAAAAMNSEAAFPPAPGVLDSALYRHARADCLQVLELSSRAGENVRGEAGWAHLARCKLANGGEGLIVLGWSRSPNAPQWGGGQASGMIAPGPRLVADPPLAGLEANARPDPANLPNNHLAYAVQWFLFALTALVIYALALRKRLKGE